MVLLMGLLAGARVRNRRATESPRLFFVAVFGRLAVKIKYIMEKMEYERPSIEVFEVNTETVILNGSPGNPGAGGGEGIGGGVDD